MRNLPVYIGVGLFTITASLAASEIYKSRPSLTLRVDSVRALPPTKVGFSRPIGTYAVMVDTGNSNMLVYCSKFTPSAGQTYLGYEAFVSGDFSPLHLWPIERESYGLPKKHAPLYRILVFRDVLQTAHPDVGCDVSAEMPKVGAPGTQ